MNERSTQAALNPDSGVVDLGFHFPMVTPTPTWTPQMTFTPTAPTYTPTPTPTEMTPTFTPTYTPVIPTNTPTPTPTAPTYTPTPSPTSPTFTPTATPGDGTATPSPTMTPPCTQLGVTLEMPAEEFSEGDRCFLTAWICNDSYSTISGHPLFVILDVYGSYWFGPSWRSMEEGIDFYSDDYEPGITQVTVIPEFNWPANVGSASEIVFWGAMTDPGITELFGTHSMVTFGWN